MFLRKNLFPLLIIVFIGAGAATAQQLVTPASPSPDQTFRERSERFGQRGERRQRRPGMEHRGSRGHFLKELNLTDEQRQQARAIMQRRLAATKSQREELFQLREKRIAGTFTADDEAKAKALRQEMRTAMQGTRGEMEALLTAEQKTRLEQLKQERKTRMEERMKKRQEFLNQNPQ
jgi:Spy/CpxP family protein refolding chaperone